MANPSTGLNRIDEGRFRGLLEAAPDAMVIIAADGRIQLVNGQTERLFGYTRDELIGQSIEILVPERLRAQHIEHRGRYFQAPGLRSMGAGLDLFGRGKDGSEFPVEISLSPLISESEVLVTAAIRDITQRKQAEHALRRSERLASLGTLTAGIAHEINNPVGAALLTAETALAVLDQPESTVRLKECLHNIVISMERCGQIVKNILRFSRNDVVDKEAIDVNHLVRNAANLIRPYADRQSAAVELHLEDDLPELIASPLELELVLVNVIRNALQASQPHQNIIVSTAPRGDDVRITVQDFGCGMTEEQKQHIFDPFFSCRQESGGTGLGMSIVYGIVHDLDGAIHVESVLGQGTTIEIVLPKASPG